MLVVRKYLDTSIMHIEWKQKNLSHILLGKRDYFQDLQTLGIDIVIREK